MADVHYTGAPDECSTHYPTKLICGRCPICQAFDSEEQEAMKWGLEHYKKVQSGMEQLKQVQMHVIELGMIDASCTCGWTAYGRPTGGHLTTVAELAEIHANHNRPSQIKDNRL